MPEQHTWTGVAHHGPDFLSHLGFVTMDWAKGARRLAFLIGAFFQALVRIFQKLATLGAELALAPVLALTIDVYHRRDGLGFSRHPGMIF
jgi:hypothetical protein